HYVLTCTPAITGPSFTAVRRHSCRLQPKTPYQLPTPAHVERLTDDRGHQPDESVARGEAAPLVQRWLDALPEKLRIVFVLADLEHMSAVEIGAATNTNPRTVYTRLRAARQRFEAAAAKHRKGEV